jgi:hypothetical protein
MRRIAAHLVLAAVIAGVLSPFVMAEGPFLHACCRRSGEHHCQGQTSDEAGFHARINLCPYSAVLVASTPYALESGKFRISAPDPVKAVAADQIDRHLIADSGSISTRSPPLLHS